jgi:gas vesicle protein
MKIVVILLAGALVGAPLASYGADESNVKSSTERVETGAKKVGEGVKETAKGIGATVVDGAKYTGEKLKESGKAAEPEARSAWSNVKEGASSFGHSVKNFFTRLFGP